MIFTAFINSFEMGEVAYKYGVKEFFVDKIFNFPFDVKLWFVYEKMVFNSDLDNLKDLLKKLESNGFYGIRCSDYSLIQIAKELNSSLKLVWDPKTGGNNLLYYDFFISQPEIARVSASKELSIVELNSLIQKYPYKIEILLFGRVRIFHSKRELLYPFIKNSLENSEKNITNKRFFLEEEKRDGEFFPIEQDENGTYIYYSKPYAINLEKLTDKEFYGVFDFQNFQNLDDVEQILKSYVNDEFFIDNLNLYSPKNINESEKIYNYERNTTPIGTVLESVRNGYIYFESPITIEQGDILRFKNLDYIISNFVDFGNGIYRIFWHKGVSSGITFEILKNEM